MENRPIDPKTGQPLIWMPTVIWHGRSKRKLLFFVLRKKRKFFWRRILRNNRKFNIIRHIWRFKGFCKFSYPKVHYVWKIESRYRIFSLRFRKLHKIWISLMLNFRMRRFRIKQFMFGRPNDLIPLTLGEIKARVRGGPHLRFYVAYRKRLWIKLRKRWIWHRLIKRTLKVNYLCYLKKYFAYNIAVRKYFDNQKWASGVIHSRSNLQQLPYFLIQAKLLPTVKKSLAFCRSGGVNVNGRKVGVRYMLKPFDLIYFDIPKWLIKVKHKRFRFKQKPVFIKRRRGLLYHRKINTYIFYRNINMRSGRGRYREYYNFFYYRNMLQPCRMR